MKEMTLNSLASVTVAPDEVIYPESDGQSMGETGFHVKLIAYFIAMLHAFFRHHDDVYVNGNMFMYYEEGNRKKFVAPDLFVVFGVDSNRLQERRSWFVWREGKAPDVVFEFTSRDTWKEDVGRKKLLYETLGVSEYFLFDPLDECLPSQ